jgi:4-hydroxybenzoate polyprenyltransferase
MSGAEAHLPLYVDLDGTLVSTDTLDECLLRIAVHRPWLLFMLPIWLWHGKAYFKDQVAAAAAHLLGRLRYRESVLNTIHEQVNAGGLVVLATGANYRIADRMSNELGVFSGVLASDAHRNLSGEAKLARIQEHSAGRPFAYIGNSRKDIPIWQAAERAIVVDSSHRLQDQIRPAKQVIVIPGDRQPTAGEWMRQLRCHQWSKNLLLVVGLILAHKLTSLHALLACLVSVVAFSSTASATYIVNDLLDLPFDREHPRKRMRPLAGDLISIHSAATMAIGLFAMAFGVSLLLLPLNFTWMLLGYIVLSICYSVWLKRVAVLDVMLLAGFYMYRVLIGAVATQVFISPWLLAFSMFFFLGLAMIKRFTDLVRAEKAEGVFVAGRAYATSDIDFFRSVGTASSCVAVLVLALYLQSQEVTKLYSRPQLLWLVCPLVLYWNLRVWFIAQRGEMPDDPILFALRDPVSYVVGALTLLLLFAAI